jgi:hypothetical protein
MTDKEMAEEYVDVLLDKDDAELDKFLDENLGDLQLTKKQAGTLLGIIKGVGINSFLAGLKAGRPQWHDLRKNPNDLPEESVIVGLSERVIGVVEIAKNQYISQECRYDFVEKIWKIHKDPYVTDVIAWCEIPTFNKE